MNLRDLIQASPEEKTSALREETGKLVDSGEDPKDVTRGLCQVVESIAETLSGLDKEKTK